MLRFTTAKETSGKREMTTRQQYHFGIGNTLISLAAVTSLTGRKYVSKIASKVLIE